MTGTLHRYRRNVTSQNGEDGVIAEILRRLGVDGGWACEFGAWDGQWASNTYPLLDHGFDVVMIEGDGDRFRDLERTTARRERRRARRGGGQIHAVRRWVAAEAGTVDSLDAILGQAGLPRDFAVLSVDVDGIDYQIWESLESYRSLVVVIEVDSSLPPGVERVHSEGQAGSSFSSMLELGRRKGYVLACHTGNMIFVREDRCDDLALLAEELAHPERLFVDDWLHPTAWRTAWRKIRGLSGPRLAGLLREIPRRLARARRPPGS